MIIIKTAGNIAAKVEEAKIKAEEIGVVIQGDDKKGIFFSNNGNTKGSYEVSDGEIRVNIEKKPMWAPQIMVAARIKALFGA